MCRGPVVMCEWLTLRLIWTLFSLFPPPPRFRFFFFFSLHVSPSVWRPLYPKSTTFLFFFLARGKLSEGETRSVSRHCSVWWAVSALPCCKVACVVCNNWLAHSQSKQVRGLIVWCAVPAQLRLGRKNDTAIKLHIRMQQWHLLPYLRRFTVETQMVPFRIYRTHWLWKLILTWWPDSDELILKYAPVFISVLFFFNADRTFSSSHLKTFVNVISLD